MVRDQIQEIEDQRSKFKHDIFMEDLKNGIELLDDKTASIQVRYDWHVGSIIAAKITRTSYSGKSVDLEVKTKERSWNSETEKYEDANYEIKKDVAYDLSLIHISEQTRTERIS